MPACRRAGGKLRLHGAESPLGGGVEALPARPSPGEGDGGSSCGGRTDGGSRCLDAGGRGTTPGLQMGMATGRLAEASAAGGRRRWLATSGDDAELDMSNDPAPRLREAGAVARTATGRRRAGGEDAEEGVACEAEDDETKEEDDDDTQEDDAEGAADDWGVTGRRSFSTAGSSGMSPLPVATPTASD